MWQALGNKKCPCRPRTPGLRGRWTGQDACHPCSGDNLIIPLVPALFLLHYTVNLYKRRTVKLLGKILRSLQNAVAFNQWPIFDSKHLAIILKQPVILNLTALLHSDLLDITCGGEVVSYEFSSLLPIGWRLSICFCLRVMEMHEALCLPPSKLIVRMHQCVHRSFREPGVLNPWFLMGFDPDLVLFAHSVIIY